MVPVGSATWWGWDTDCPPLGHDSVLMARGRAGTSPSHDTGAKSSAHPMTVPVVIASHCKLTCSLVVNYQNRVKELMGRMPVCPWPDFAEGD